VTVDLSTNAVQGAAVPRRASKPIIGCALGVAAIANILVPVLFFSETRLFGQTDPRYRAMIAAVVAVEYGIAFLLVLLHANVGFAAGYAVATSAAVTLGSAGLAYIILAPAGWGWSVLYAETLVVAGIAFAVVSNVVFLIASIRYARAIHPRLHVPGFALGVAASLALLFIYTRILR
jgi:hypothetical protein